MKFTESTEGNGKLIIEFGCDDSRQTKELVAIQWKAIRSLISALLSKSKE